MLKRMTIQILMAAGVIALGAGLWSATTDARPDLRWDNHSSDHRDKDHD